jgi:signal transduction histidine kinase
MKKAHPVTCLLSALLIALLFSTTVIAGEDATKDECVAKTKAAAQLFQEKGLDAALEQINNKTGPFVWKNSYVFCIDLDKQCNIAHPITPALIGKNLMGAKDVNGKMFFAEFISTAKNQGEGWVSYMWPKPGETTPSLKSTFIYRVPGQNVAMLAGIYE